MELNIKVKDGVTIVRYRSCFLVKYKGKLLFSQKFVENDTKMYTYYLVVHHLVKLGLVHINVDK